MAADAARLLQLVEDGREDAAVAWHSFANVFSIGSRQADSVSARRFINGLLAFVTVPPTNPADLASANGKDSAHRLAPA